MSLSVDVVIPVRDNYALTDACLRSLAAQAHPHCVIVYDDVSTDGTPERLAADWPHATVVSGQGRIGFAAASNRAAAAGKGDVIVLLNNDVECGEDFVAELITPLERAPRLGSVAAVMLQPGERTIDSVGLTCDPTLAAYPRLRGAGVERASDTRPALAGPAGTAAAYRRQAWEQVGGLDGTIMGYMEDFDLALRLRVRGWQTAAAPRAVGVHLGSATYGHRSATQRLHAGFARGYLLRRYGVLRSRRAPRALLTEAAVVVADSLLSKDAVALRGRIAGHRAASGRPLLPPPPPAVIESEIGWLRSIALRREVSS